MFHLHESTQRKLCRGAFLALCLAPTLLLAVYALRLQTPGYRAAVASELAQAAGVVVSLDDLVHQRPGHTRLTNVRLCDPETGAEIAQIRELEIVDSGDYLVLHAAQPKLNARHFALVFQRFEQRVLRAGRASAPRIELRAADLTITSPSAEAQTLRNVLLTVSRKDEGVVAELHYQVAGVAMPEPATLRLARTTSSEGIAATQLAWHTGGAALPVAPWAARFPWLKHVGKHCHFRGELSAEETPSGWRGELGGELRRIDLDELIGDQFPHKVSGDARAIVEALRFEHGRVVFARGRIEAGPGVIGQSLVAAAEQQFSLQIDGARETSAEPDALRRYSQLALHFSLDENAMKLRGECGDAPEGTALRIEGEHYRTRAENSLSPLALVRALSPLSDHQVPATDATRLLVQWLPLPEGKLRADDTARGHLRGAGE